MNDQLTLQLRLLDASRQAQIAIEHGGEAGGIAHADLAKVGAHFEAGAFHQGHETAEVDRSSAAGAAQGADDGAFALEIDGSLQVVEAKGQAVVIQAHILNIHGAVHAGGGPACRSGASAGWSGRVAWRLGSNTVSKVAFAVPSALRASATPSVKPTSPAMSSSVEGPRMTNRLSASRPSE